MYSYLQEISDYKKLKGKVRAEFQESMIKNRVNELSYYLDQSPTDVLYRMEQFSKLTKRMWEARNPKTDAEILDFYKESNSYIYELTMNECDAGKIDQMIKMMELIDKYKPRTILVYGSGVASEALVIKESTAKVAVVIADVVSLHHKFGYYRMMRRNLDVTAIAIKENSYGAELPQNYNMIVCFDTLEHVADPELCARNLYMHLHDEGILLAVFMFNKDSGKLPEKRNTHPLHITHNKDNVLLRGAHFKSYLRGIGFKTDWKAYGSQWIKILEK